MYNIYQTYFEKVDRVRDRDINSGQLLECEQDNENEQRLVAGRGEVGFHNATYGGLGVFALLHQDVLLQIIKPLVRNTTLKESKIVRLIYCRFLKQNLKAELEVICKSIGNYA